MNLLPIAGRDNKAVKYKDIEYPQPKSLDLPKNYYTALVIGGTGSGKTNSIVKLLKYYEKEKIFTKEGELTEQRIILLSPTFQSNTIWRTLKNLDVECDVYEQDYTNAMFQAILDDIDAIRDEAKQYQKVMKIWKKFKKVKKISLLTNAEVLILQMIDFDIENLFVPKFKVPPVTHLILDDLVCSPAFKPNSLVSNLSVRNRHRGINLFILAQSAKQITKIIRIQARILMLYRFNSNNICSDLYELVSNVLTPEQFEQIYMEITSEPYQFLLIDNTKSKLQLKKNFNYLIEPKNILVEKKSSKKNKKTTEEEPCLPVVVDNKK